MRPTKILLTIALFAAAATALPDTADARHFGGGGARAAHFHGGGARVGWHGGGTRWHGGGTRWAGGRYYRGGYYNRGWGAAAAGVATGAALGAAAAYGSSYGSCYRTQSVWNGYTYVQRNVNVC